MIAAPWTLRIGDGQNGATGVGYIEGPHPQGYSWAREIAVVYGMEDFSDEARLIVAAPDMLATLKNVRESLRGFIDPQSSRFAVEIKWLNAAIAKAEGR